MSWWWAVLLLPLLQALCSAAFEFPDASRGCAVLRTYSMLGADCSNKHLYDIPQSLDSRIEVLDVSENRLRELPRGSLSRYSSLRFLYLGDNLIDITDDAAFSPLSSLEVLDLSLNGLTKIPFNVLQLPALRKLDISRNRLYQLQADDYQGAPLSNSLKVLSVSSNKLRHFPPLWMVPQLEYLNVSGNELQLVKVTDLAPLCRLKELDVSHNPQLFKQAGDKCDCYLFTSWVEKRGIALSPKVPLNCPPTENALCENSTTYREAQELHSKCNAGVETFQRQAAAKRTWLWAGIAALLLLVAILIGSVFFHCRKSSKRKVCANNNNEMACDEVKKVPPDPSSSQLLQDL